MTRFAVPVLGPAGAWLPSQAAEARTAKPRMIEIVRVFMGNALPCALAKKGSYPSARIASTDSGKSSHRPFQPCQGRRCSECQAEAGADGETGRAVAPHRLVIDVEHVVDTDEELETAAEIGRDHAAEEDIAREAGRGIGIDAEIAVEAAADPEDLGGEVEAPEE